MANSKKRLLTVLSVLVVMCMMMFSLTACGTDSVVKFMVQNANGEWQMQSEETVKDGTVNAPEAPAKDYYTFAGWYLDKEGTNAFENKDVKGNLEVYARYNPVKVNITINGKDEGVQNLVDVVNKQYNPGDGLEFDGWYKDAACTEGTRWNGTETVNSLFAKSVAAIKFTNGWTADDFTVKVNPGEKLDLQKEVVLEDQTTTTFELANIVKPYMSKYDLEYVDENGATVDFSQAITKNMNVTVLWNSKGISKDHFKELPKNKGFYMYRLQTIAGMDIKDAPILSIRNKVTFEEKDADGNISLVPLNLESIKFMQKCLPDTVKKIIIGDGIKAVQGMNGNAASAVEEIVLPSSLKIIDTSFNNMPNLKGVTLPDGLEVLIDSFFIEAGVGPTNDQGLGKANPNFEIAVPDSVINIAMMPNNLKFSKTKDTAEKGDFYKGEDGKIYLNDERGLILVSDPAAVEENFVEGSYIRAKAGVIIVPEGVVGIQVGTYETYFDRLVLPSTFKFVNYNADLTKYEKFYDIYTGGTTEGANVLMIPSQYKQYFTDDNSIQPSFSNDSNIDFRGIAITTTIGSNHTTGIVEMSMSKEACTTANVNFGFVKKPIYGDAVTLPNLDNFVNFKDSVNSVFVSVSFMNNDYKTLVVAKLSDVKNISYAAVKEALIARNSDIKGTLDVNNIELFNEETKVKDGAAVINDMYLTVDLIKINALNINSNFMVKGRPGPPPWDYSDPAHAPVQRVGNCTAKMIDITGLSQETLKTVIIDAAAKVLLNNPQFGMPNDETIIKNNLKYFYDRATKVELKVNGQVVDLSSINIDNGDVTLDVVWTFA